MSSNAALAERRAAKWAATADKAQKRMDQARAAGDAAAIANAQAKLQHARKMAAKNARIARVVASLDKAAERVQRRAPRLAKRWKDDRAKEPKRIKARTKDLQKRTTKDQNAVDTSWRRRKPGAAASGLPEAATWPTGPIVPFQGEVIEDHGPPREGLMPGDYEPQRAARMLGQLVTDKPRRPARWTPEYVGDRMVDAFRVLRRLPMSIWPKQYGAMWPDYLSSKADAFGQTITGTLQERNRSIRGTGAEEVERMNEALAWPMEHLSGDPELARAVNDWALWSELDGDALDSIVYEGLTIIAEGLNARNVVVR